jgi:hypothetical protein
MTQAEFNKMVNADIKARVDSAAAQYKARISEEEYFEADLTPAQQSYADEITKI